MKKCPNTYKFCNDDITKFILLSRQGGSSYEHMDSWKRYDETTHPNKKAFYSELYLEDITDKDYIHAKKVFKEFEIKNLGEYSDLYI